MKENSTEEDIARIAKLITTKFNNDYSIDNKDKEAIEHILSDYKGVLKENEELLQEKINNQKIIALAQNNMLNYQAGFEDGKNGRTSAVQSIIENQQYYIFQKQIEKYERHIEKLQKENEELNYKLHSKKITLEIYNRYIPKSKVEEIIEELKINLVNMQGEELLIYESKIDILKELLGESEE